jgi:hypothetical protein
MAMNHAGHQAHFLRRVDRLDHHHADLAMGLYRDPNIVRYLFDITRVPPDEGRVALALDDAGRGPFVIVTRDGRFVTCLGRGMKVGQDTRLLSRRALDLASTRVEGLRGLLRKASHLGRRRIGHLMERLLQAGPALSREEYDDLLSWSPLVEAEYVRALKHSVSLLSPLYARLCYAKRVGRRHEPVLRAYWETAWAVAHLTALLGSNDLIVEGMAEWLDRKGSLDHATRLALFCPLFDTWMAPLSLRATWLPAAHPKVFFETLKHALSERSPSRAMLPAGFALAATVFRHGELRAEAEELVDRMTCVRGEHGSDSSRAGGQLFRAALSLADRGLGNYATRVGRSSVHDLVTARATNQATRQLAAAMPDDAARAFGLSKLGSVWNGEADLKRFMALLPEVATLRARDFYLPEAYASRFLSRYSFENALAYFDSRKNADPGRTRAPLVAPKTPGRNDPCSCGSGTKYKRCCGIN